MNDIRDTALPLSGIRVIDFTQVMMGPVCTQMLGDYGADVVKIERAGAGDLSRSTFPPIDGVDNPIFCSLNRNKRSVALDLRDPASMAQVKALVAGADVVVNNFRAGVMDRMGLGYEELRRINPRLIYAVGTGFGLTGPYAHKGGQDVLAQAMSGVMARRSRDSDPLAVNATTFADYSAGMHLMQGVLLALLQREKTGRGQQFSVSLLDSMIAAQTQEAATHMMRGSELNWGAMPLSGVFETQDGALVMVGAFKADPVKDIGTALGIAGLENDPRFSTHALRMQNKVALQAIFHERFKTNTTAHWIKKLEEQDLLCAPVRSLAQALADEQATINGMIMQAPGAVETVKVVGSPIHMSDAPVTIRIAPATLGQHTQDVLAELAQARPTAAE